MLIILCRPPTLYLLLSLCSEPREAHSTPAVSHTPFSSPAGFQLGSAREAPIEIKEQEDKEFYLLTPLTTFLSHCHDPGIPIGLHFLKHKAPHPLASVLLGSRTLFALCPCSC